MTDCVPNSPYLLVWLYAVDMDREARILATASFVYAEGLGEAFNFEVFPEDTLEMQREVFHYLSNLAGGYLPAIWISQVGLADDGLPICLLSDESPRAIKRRLILRTVGKIVLLSAGFVLSFFLYSKWKK